MTKREKRNVIRIAISNMYEEIENQLGIKSTDKEEEICKELRLEMYKKYNIEIDNI